jgi:deoxyribodipyrimidine photo-lyase
MAPNVPSIRIAAKNRAEARAKGDFVLYWMIAFRRMRWNFALDRAIEWARELRKPLVILEALRCDYEWASDRTHRFVLDGMAEKARELEDARVFYYPYVERAKGEGKGLLEALAKRACVVVTDDFPCFFLPPMVASGAKKVSVKLEAIDSHGLLPLRATDQAFPTAFAFRRFLQKSLPAHLQEFPSATPLARLELPRLRGLSTELLRSWPAAPVEWLEDSKSVATLPIDHTVPAAEAKGGEAAARQIAKKFIASKLASYSESRNEPEEEATSGLSAHLHFGHISSHEVFRELMEKENWSERKLALRANGSREGWWGVSKPAEAFLDQLVTWREVGFNMSSHRRDYDEYGSLPEWAQKTLRKHTRDKRQWTYSLQEFADAETHDRLWNAAQQQLATEGRLHNYLRMLWGKKILEWSRTPQDALRIMIELNNRYALDGRDPNSYSGIFWCLGRYDRAWGPERPIFGTVRYMSSENTGRKVRVKDYIRKYSGAAGMNRALF